MYLFNLAAKIKLSELVQQEEIFKFHFILMNRLIYNFMPAVFSHLLILI